MGTLAEQVAGDVALEVSSAISIAQDDAAIAAETAAQIVAGAMESERGQMVRNLELELDECRSDQATMSETLVNMSSQLAELSGAVSALLTLQTPPPPPPESERADGPPESPDLPEGTETVELPPPPPEPVPPPPAKRKRRFI